MLVRQRRQKKLYPPINETGNLVTTDMEKAEGLNNFFLPQFSLAVALPRSLKSLNLNAGTGGMKFHPL